MEILHNLPQADFPVLVGGYQLLRCLGIVNNDFLVLGNVVVVEFQLFQFVPPISLTTGRKHQMKPQAFASS